MEADPKRSRAVKGLLILVVMVVLGILGFAGWHNRHQKTNTNTAATYSNTCPIAAPTADNNWQLPNGWNWYEIKGIGLKYAYPKSWDSPTTQTNSGRQQYAASFTAGPAGANTIVILGSDCSGFQAALSDINSGKFDTLSGPTITRAIEHNQTSYSSLSHWSSDSGNQYKLITYAVVNAGSVRSVTVGYSIVTGSEVCPEDRLAPSSQPKCIDQSISDEVDQVIGSLQKI